jgi:chromosome segregation ATPase
MRLKDMAIDIPTIHAAADRIAESGEKPTLARVRRELGGGSFTTISEAMQSWRAQQSEEHALGEVVVPDTLNERIEQLKAAMWQTAIAEAERRLSAEREALHEAQEQATAQVVEAQEAVTTLEFEAEERDRELNQLRNQLLDAEAVAKEAISAKQQAEQQRESDAARLGERIDGLESRLNDAIEGRKAAEGREANIQKQFDALNSKVTHLTDKNLELEKLLAGSQSQASERDSTIYSLRSDISILKKEHKEEISLLKKEQSKLLEGKKADFDTRLNEKDAALKKLEYKLSEAEKMLFDEIEKSQRLRKKEE